jgi:hypothetical protein
MTGRSGWVTAPEIPPEAWKLALGRTRGLAVHRLGWDPNLDHLVANAYLQGVADVGANLELVKRILDEATPKPALEDYYGGA